MPTTRFGFWASGILALPVHICGCLQLLLVLLQESEAEVAQHLQQVDCPALLLGLPWIMTAFAGHLAVGEVLLLWDRIIAFDSLLLLPVLAVAVLAFRRQVSILSSMPCCVDACLYAVSQGSMLCPGCCSM